MISVRDRVRLRLRLGRRLREKNRGCSAAELASWLSDFEWLLDEIDRQNVPKPVTFVNGRPASIDRLELA